MMSGRLILVPLVVESVDIRTSIKAGGPSIHFNDCFNLNVLI
ncbi:hypothetical protein AWV72_02735 [Lactiplantibacillus plantarum]|nr:hypothetical protein AWV72_02735 [Lactiplantibacillus plantarum]